MSQHGKIVGDDEIKLAFVPILSDALGHLGSKVRRNAFCFDDKARHTEFIQVVSKVGLQQRRAEQTEARCFFKVTENL